VVPGNEIEERLSNLSQPDHNNITSRFHDL
jgi:hypothetical protein